jgi:hypothetical protein
MWLAFVSVYVQSDVEEALLMWLIEERVSTSRFRAEYNDFLHSSCSCFDALAGRSIILTAISTQSMEPLVQFVI